MKYTDIPPASRMNISGPVRIQFGSKYRLAILKNSMAASYIISGVRITNPLLSALLAAAIRDDALTCTLIQPVA